MLPWLGSRTVTGGVTGLFDIGTFIIRTNNLSKTSLLLEVFFEDAAHLLDKAQRV